MTRFGHVLPLNTLLLWLARMPALHRGLFGPMFMFWLVLPSTSGVNRLLRFLLLLLAALSGDDVPHAPIILSPRIETSTTDSSDQHKEGPKVAVDEKGLQTDDSCFGQKFDISCEAEAGEILRATERTRPDWSFREECQKRVDEHVARHPGGVLPSEIRDVEVYIANRKRQLNIVGQKVPRCQFCGHG